MDNRHVQRIKDLKITEEYFINTCEESGGNVRRVTDTSYVLEEVTYGGLPLYYKRYLIGEEEEIVNTVLGWT